MSPNSIRDVGTRHAMTDPGIARILRAGRAAVALTYSLTLIENACMLAYPALTGLAVDGLLKRDFLNQVPTLINNLARLKDVRARL